MKPLARIKRNADYNSSSVYESIDNGPIAFSDYIEHQAKRKIAKAKTQEEYKARNRQKKVK